MKTFDRSDIDCMIEMRDACAACFRVIADHDLDFDLEFRLRKAGVKDGFGLRFQELIDKMRIERANNKYSKLIMEVACKFPGESRHETALRYIREAENRAKEGSSEPKITFEVIDKLNENP